MGGSYSERVARWRVPLGFGLAVAYLVFAQPTLRLLEAGSAVSLAGLGLRGWAAGHLDKNQSLTTTGPYASTRNPLYLGSLLLGLGFALAGGSWPLAAAFVCLFAFVYWPVIRREESSLRAKFGAAYEGYAADVPLLLPLRWPRRVTLDSPRRFAWQQYKKNREYEAGIGYVLGILFLALKLALR